MLSTNYIPPHGPGVSSPLLSTAQGSLHPCTYTAQWPAHPSPTAQGSLHPSPHGPGGTSPLLPTAQGSPHPSTYMVQRSLHPSPSQPRAHLHPTPHRPGLTCTHPPTAPGDYKVVALGYRGHRKGGPGRVTGQRLCWCEARKKDGSDQGSRGPAPWRGVGACEMALRGLRPCGDHGHGWAAGC